MAYRRRSFKKRRSTANRFWKNRRGGRLKRQVGYRF